MPKKLELAPHLSTETLQDRYRKAKDSVEVRRWHLLWKVSQGWSCKDSAYAVGLNYDYARRFIRKYNEMGEEAVPNQRPKNSQGKGGGERLLNTEQLNRLKEALKQKPEDKGLWTGPKVARWMEQETGRTKIHNQRGWEYLKKLNYSWLIPRPKHSKGCPIQQQEFKKNLPLKVYTIKENHPGVQVEVWFFDEHRVRLKPILAKVWSLKGERSIVLVNHRYEWLYVYGFVNPSTGQTCWDLIPQVNVQWLNLVFEAFAAEIGASEEKIILLVQDRAGWHMSDKVCLPKGMVVEPLPPYSPELQPAERLWK